MSSAAERIKTFGTFVAGGLVGGLIAGALHHGWGHMVSNGFDPFGDGGKATYKATDASRGTATQAGFAVRPLTASTGEGERFNIAAIPTYIIPTAEAAAIGGNPASSQPLLLVEKAGARKVVKLQRQPAHKKPAHQAKRPPAAKPKTGNRQKDGHGAGKPAGKPTKAINSGTASNGNWIDQLMPGKPTPAVYYSYNANPSAKEKPAPANSWVGKLVTDGNQKVKVNSGKVGMATHKKSDLHTGAGQTGKALTGGSGDFPNWSEGKTSKDKVMVCIKDECV